jgi:hypothetical protein
VAAIGPGLQVELDRADQPVALERRQQMPPAGTYGIDDAPPVGQSLDLRQGCKKTDRGPALDRIDQQPDELGAAGVDRRRVERTDRGQALWPVQVGRPSIG